MPSLSEKLNVDVEKGDLIFYVKMTEENGKLTFDSEQAVHVAIVTSISGKGKRAKIEIADASIAKGLVVRNLPTPSNTFDYVVYRHSNNEFANIAADIAYEWAKPGNIKYDEARLAIMEKLLAENSLECALERSKKEFFDEGYWRALKFKMRGGKPISEGSQRALRCDQFVILCYQVAAIRVHVSLSKEVSTLPFAGRNDISKVSLKYYNSAFLDKGSPLLTYFEAKFKSMSTNNERIGSTAPVVAGLSNDLQTAIFSGEVDFPRLGFIPLDAKLCSPSVLLTFFIDGSGGAVGFFQPVGILPGKLKKALPSPPISEQAAILEGYITSEQDSYYTDAIKKAVIDILLARVLESGVELNREREIMRDYSSNNLGPREMARMYLYGYLCQLLHEDERIIAIELIDSCLGQEHSPADSLVSHFTPTPSREPAKQQFGCSYGDSR